MLRPRRCPALVAAPLLLVACSDGGDGQQRGITPDDARRWNDAAEMLDADSVALNAVANDQDQP